MPGLFVRNFFFYFSVFLILLSIPQISFAQSTSYAPYAPSEAHGYSPQSSTAIPGTISPASQELTPDDYSKKFVISQTGVANPVPATAPAATTALAQPAPVITHTATATVTAPLPAVATAAVALQPASVIPQTLRWTGPYAGLQMGGAFGTSHTTYISRNGIPYIHQSTTGDFSTSGALGGFTVGYNKQFRNFVAGLEGDFSISNITGSAYQPNHNFIYTTENPWLATLRPRLGYAFGRVMPYVTGGLAVSSEHITVFPKAGGLNGGSDFLDTELGWTAGGGLETAIAPNWSMKAEYLYVRSEDAKGLSANNELTNTSFHQNIGRVGLNYKFDHPTAETDQAPPDYFSNASSDKISLATLTGVELGGQISDYRYQEHVVSDTDFMHERGDKFGVTATATKAFQQGPFISGDFRFAYSSNDYASPGSGIQHHIPDYLWDTRLLAGKDFIFNNAFAADRGFDVSPYLGLGYRNLLNNARGLASSGSHGYLRDSQYFYLPVGVTPRFRISDDARISTNFEYDQLIEGWQTSDLSDLSNAYITVPNITNNQSGGYGLRGSLMYERMDWSVGPFFNYWNIDKSGDNAYIPGYPNYYVFEPHNQTLEYGMQARYRF